MLPQDGRVVSNFIVQALENKPITIYGDGSQSRSFCYVDDLIDGLIKLMNGNESGPINIGNPNEFTILDLANLIRRKVNPRLDIIYKKLPDDDPTQRKPLIKKAKENLNWEPKIDLEIGLDKTISYFREELNVMNTNIKT